MSCAITTDCHWLDREADVPKCHFRLSRSELPNRPRVGEWENDNETFCPFDCALSFSGRLEEIAKAWEKVAAFRARNLYEADE